MEKIVTYSLKNRIKWAFFDYFGTTVNRNCTPDEVKKLWAKRMSEKLRFSVDNNLLYETRIGAEKKLQKKRDNGEIIYDEVIKEIYIRMKLCAEKPWAFSEDEFLSLAFDAECECEKEVQIPCEEICSCIKKLHLSGIKTAIISDFYLPKEAFMSFLTYHKLEGFVDRVFVSADYGENKHSGTLYKTVLRTLGVEGKECIMTGDNERADIHNSKSFGITPFKAISHDEDATEELKGTIEAIYRKHYKGALRYSNYAFLFYLAMENLYRDMVEEKISDIYFLSREGEFLKKLFDSYLERREDTRIKSHYLYVSRKATYPATLKELSVEEFSLLRKYKKFSIRDFTDNVGIFSEGDTSFFEEINIDERINNFFESEQFLKLKEAHEFIELYEKSRKENIAKLKRYFEEQGLVDGDKTVVVADVGWNGTMQDNIFKIVGKKCRGYYIGVLGDADSLEENMKKGLIFSENPYRTKDCEVWKYDHTFMERLLWASHGATEGYLEDSGKIMPVLKEYESEKNNYSMILPVQKALLEKFLLIDEAILSSPYFAKDLYPEFLKKHIDTVFTLNNKQISLQKYMIDNQMQNFGNIVSAKTSLEGVFGLRRILRKMFSHFKVFKNTEVLFRILQVHNFKFFIKVLYFFKRKSLLKKLGLR